MNLYICQQCGSKFQSYKAYDKRNGNKYCSMNCYGKSHRKENNVRFIECNTKCKHCGGTFHQKPSAIKLGRGKKYCSSRCRVMHLRKTIICGNCNKPFSVPVSHSNKSICCSRHCHNEFLKKTTTKITLKCFTCHKIFQLKRSEKLGVHAKTGAGSFCSMACKAKYQSANPLTVTGVQRSTKGGKRSDLNNLYVRSSWEANYARYLNYLQSKGLISKWEFEPDTFKFETPKLSINFYTPDFKITTMEGCTEYHEVKGYFDKISQQKMVNMKKYYPLINVVLIDSSRYMALHKKYRYLISKWESPK